MLELGTAKPTPAETQDEIVGHVRLQACQLELLKVIFEQAL
jgi:hypothetical protein